jgi:uncharacterized membrane protein
MEIYNLHGLFVGVRVCAFEKPQNSFVFVFLLGFAATCVSALHVCTLTVAMWSFQYIQVFAFEYEYSSENIY